MIETTVLQLKEITTQLHKAVIDDIHDVKKANHESLVNRNEIKLELMNDLTSLKESLNQELATEYRGGADISIYKNGIDELEIKLKELYSANGKLASIVLPVKEMYKEIIDDITKQNGGSLIEVMA